MQSIRNIGLLCKWNAEFCRGRREQSTGVKKLDLSALEAEASRIQYKLSYNQNERWWEEILKVWTQKVGTDYTAFWTVMFDLAPIPESLREWFAAMLFNISAVSIRADDDLKAHLKEYKKELNDARRFIVVSHSQGNLYTLEALTYLRGYVDELREPAHTMSNIGIGNVQVATPAHSEAWDLPWITFQDDLVIRIVSRLLGTAAANLPEIGSGPAPRRDPLGHNFIKAYINTDASRKKLKSDILAVAEKLRYPSLGKSAFTIRAETVNDTGLEMVLRRPNGKNLKVIAGESATGDIFQFRERCSSVTEGNYTLSFDTFWADVYKAPYPVTITLSEGDRTYKYRTMATAGVKKGREGDLLKIGVSRESSGAYSVRVDSRLAPI